MKKIQALAAVAFALLTSAAQAECPVARSAIPVTIVLGGDPGTKFQIKTLDAVKVVVSGAITSYCKRDSDAFCSFPAPQIVLRNVHLIPETTYRIVCGEGESVREKTIRILESKIEYVDFCPRQ